MTAPVTVSPESSIFAENRADATSGGALYLGGNPTAAALLGASNQGAQWLVPAAIVAAVLLFVTMMRRR